MVKNHCKSLREACLSGALFQAVRDIVHGYPDWRVKEFVKRRFPNLTDDQLTDLIRLAHAGIVAGGQLQRMEQDERLPAGQIPKLPGR